jgi:hypothetical protein
MGVQIDTFDNCLPLFLEDIKWLIPSISKLAKRICLNLASCKHLTVSTDIKIFAANIINSKYAMPFVSAFLFKNDGRLQFTA